MDIEVKVATILLEKASPRLESTAFSLTLAEGTDVRGLIAVLGIPPGMVGSVTINKKRQSLEAAIRSGDKVAIIPAISGG
jgi:molybdopterin converting factor small subunit